MTLGSLWFVVDVNVRQQQIGNKRLTVDTRYQSVFEKTTPFVNPSEHLVVGILDFRTMGCWNTVGACVIMYQLQPDNGLKSD